VIIACQDMLSFLAIAKNSYLKKKKIHQLSTFQHLMVIKQSLQIRHIMVLFSSDHISEEQQAI
jgi:hypothetical protein